MKNKLLLFLFILFPSVAFASNELLISKSVFVQVATPETYEFQTNVFTYFPAGTRLYKGDLAVSYRMSIRRLVFSESGVAAYIKDGMYWDNDQLQSLRRTGGDKWVFITRPKDIIVSIADGVRLVVGFSRGEKYPLVTESDGSFIIKVGKDKIPGVDKSFVRNISIPRANGAMVDLSKNITPREAAGFRLSVVDGISGIRKPCNTKTAIASRHGGAVEASAGFSLKKFWLWLGAKGEIKASYEKSNVEEFDKNTNVIRRYYVRDFRPGVYKVTRYTACEGAPDRSFTYTNPDMNEVVISRKWGEKTHLDLDWLRGLPLITCPRQYFDFYDALVESSFNDKEIPFIISQTAIFRSLTSSSCSKPEM